MLNLTAREGFTAVENHLAKFSLCLTKESSRKGFFYLAGRQPASVVSEREHGIVR